MCQKWEKLLCHKDKVLNFIKFPMIKTKLLGSKGPLDGTRLLCF